MGTVDTVCRQLETLVERLPVDWLFCWTYNALVPHEVLMRSIGRFYSEVLPRFEGSR